MDSKQVVLITGASTGFGRLFAETLARHGHTVFATMRDPGGRNAKNASEIRSLAEKESLPLHVLELDVTDDASVEQAVRNIVEPAGRIAVSYTHLRHHPRHFRTMRIGVLFGQLKSQISYRCPPA